MSAPKCTNYEELIKEYGDMTSFVSVRVTFLTIYSAIFVIGIFGNLSVLTLILKKGRRLHGVSCSDLLLLNLTLAGLLLCMTTVPTAPIIYLYKSWFWGAIMCKLVPFSQGVAVVVNSFSLVLVAMDRYCNMVTPHGPFRISSIRVAVCVVLVCWIVAALLNVPYALTMNLWSKVTFDHVTLCEQFCVNDGWRHPSQKSTYSVVMFCVKFLVPSVWMIFFYQRIASKVQSDFITLRRATHQPSDEQTRYSKRKRTVLIILRFMVLTYLVCWLPTSMLHLIADLQLLKGALKSQRYLLNIMSHCVAMTTVIWNPILYFWMSSRHRTQLRRFCNDHLISKIIAKSVNRPLLLTRHQWYSALEGNAEMSHTLFATPLLSSYRTSTAITATSVAPLIHSDSL